MFFKLRKLKPTLMSIDIQVVTMKRLNLALLQNKIPLVKRIELINEGPEPVENIRLKITSDPDGALIGETAISLIAPGEHFILDTPKLSHSWDFFKNVNEKIHGRLLFELRDHSDTSLAKTSTEVEIEPETVWLGQEAPLELLVSHISPNSPSVQQINKRASEILKTLSGNSALNGYQSKDKGRVYQIAQAIYQAIREVHITYSQPPASFEEAGQKIRTPDQILNSHLATCLDITLLYAACLEQAGIFPLVFIVQGHAFTGFWLEDKFLPRPLEEDPQFFRKRIELDEMIVVEITGVTADHDAGFSQLEIIGRDFFKEEKSFICGIDVQHCRRHARIFPLSNYSDGPVSDEDKREKRIEEVTFENREFKTFDIPEDVEAKEKELDKWKDKLLDLSFRNRLLNFRSNRGSVEILCHSPNEIEDLLADGAAFEISPVPSQSALNSNRTDQKEILSDQITASFERKKLLTTISEDKYGAIMNSLYRSVVNSVEETGSNTLFLALGFLSWRETGRSAVERKSPLLLLPVNLTKKSVGGGFSLTLRDDETVLNHTLLQKLKRDFDLDFPGLDPLPQDESGVHVSLIFDIIRKIIRDKRGWEVKEEVWLSEFSFQKYLMWKELADHYEDMLRSPVIRRIMTSEVPAEAPEFITEEKVESFYHPKELYCPLSADSSQMAAILSAANGNSFVLQGPPGTGKSQTIANMISHCIGIGKKVLFVSEKKVALEVVYRRLQEIGLGPFCLELHSNKSEKKAVVNSFYDALEFRADHLDEQWDQVSEELKFTRDGLNKYFNSLHKKSTAGITAYKAFGVANRNRDLPRVDLEFESFLDFPASELYVIKKKLMTWSEYSDSLSQKDFLAWAAVKNRSWNSQTEDNLIQLLENLQTQLLELKEINESKDSKLPVNKEWKLNQWQVFESFVGRLLECPLISPSFLEVLDFRSHQDKILDYLSHLKRQDEHRAVLDGVFLPDIYDLNFRELKMQLTSTQSGFFLSRFFRERKFKSLLTRLLKDTLEPLEVYQVHFDTGIAYQSGQGKAGEGARFIKEAMGVDYRADAHVDYENALSWAREVQELLVELYSYDFDQVKSVKTFIANILSNRAMALSGASEFGTSLRSYRKVLKELIATRVSLEETLELEADFFNCSLTSLADKLGALKKTSSLFRDITSMNLLKIELSEAGLRPLFAEVDKGAVPKEKVADIFNFNYHRQWLNERTATSEILNNTTGLQLNTRDAVYKKVDEQYRSLSGKALSSRVSADKPKLSSFTLSDTPVGLIVRENKKSRRHLPIRKFLDSISSVSQALKPCYLMSPMSVSQYLPVSPDFDIVIFDEASQIPPWDAIGALARGTQAIIVGDTKQLPPTSFFSSKSEDESDELIDSESILEMFGGMYPEMLLKWHYRSRSESLISFSNHHIYDNRLHTFPASRLDDNKVSLEIVTGKEAYFDRGKSKTNRGEAQAVISEIFRRIKSPEHSDSIGVVTFSSSQATLISDLIDQRLQEEPEFEYHFDVSNPEYIFVKNIENVQGDERDVILFSVGYGKDNQGRIRKNFGPLNNIGGERRLNVAVTRARHEVKIFSNFHPRELDVSTSVSLGLKLLKEYLLYALDGPAALLRNQSVNDVDDFDSPFEKEVAQELRKKGWTVGTQIGVGGYRVDLGVVHPDYPGQFLAGIECDGARYHSAKTARDRDILRQMVLEGLGWTILRIWSTDWWYDSGKCIDQIDQELKEILQGVEMPVKENVHVSDKAKEDFEVSKGPPEKEERPFENDMPVYDPSVLNLSVEGTFFDKWRIVDGNIKEVVEKLGPISRDECYTIVAKAWGFARRGARIDKFMDSNSKKIHKTSLNGETFFWNTPEDVAALTQLRVPKNGEQRAIGSVAPEELSLGFVPILQGNIEVPKEVLFKEVGKMLGYRGLSKSTLKSMYPALEILKNKQLVREEEGKIIWIGEVEKIDLQQV